MFREAPSPVIFNFLAMYEYTRHTNRWIWNQIERCTSSKTDTCMLGSLLSSFYICFVVGAHSKRWRFTLRSKTSFILAKAVGSKQCWWQFRKVFFKSLFKDSSNHVEYARGLPCHLIMISICNIRWCFGISEPPSFLKIATCILNWSSISWSICPSDCLRTNSLRPIEFCQKACF